MLYLLSKNFRRLDKGGGRGIETMARIFDTQAVSYTHLDVYKRQALIEHKYIY